MDSKSIARRDSEKLTYGIQKLRPFAGPGMIEIYPLAALGCLRDFLRMRESILNLAGQVPGIAKFEVDQVTIAEIVLNGFRPGSNDRFAQCKILKNPCRSVNFGKDIFMVRYNTEIAGGNGFYDSVQVLNTKIINVVLEISFAGDLHHVVQER